MIDHQTSRKCAIRFDLSAGAFIGKNSTLIIKNKPIAEYGAIKIMIISKLVTMIASMIERA